MWESESFNYGQDLGLRRGRERKRRADNILLDVKDKLSPPSHPRERRVAVHLPSHPASNFLCQLYKAVFPWLRFSLLIYEMVFIFPLFQGFGER